MATMALAAAPASAETLYGLTETDKLVTFDSATPGTVSVPRAITGLQAGETVKGIDFRPATLQLYALGSTGRLYTVNLTTGAATQVGSPLTLSGTDFGFDFNPTVDRLRIISDTDQNLRVNPENGALVAADTPLAFQTVDPNTGDNPVATAAAYTKNAPASAAFPGAPSTALFDLDTGNDALVLQSPPNEGKLNTIGPLGVDVTAVAGFDISTSANLATDTAYAALRLASDPKSRLYTINLNTGAATAVALTGGADAVKDIAVGPVVPAFAVLTSGTVQGLSIVRADQPGTPSLPVPISGLQIGERLVGIDRRANGGALYGLGSNSRVYTLNPVTGAATAVAGTAFTPALSGDTFGVDFNPVPDRLRVVSNTRKSFRVNQLDGTVAGSDTDLSFLAGDPNATATPNVTAAGYTNSVSPAPPSTTLFDLDTGVDALVIQGNPDPNAGVLATVGALGVDPTDNNGFDIAPRFNHQFAALQTAASGPSSLYAVNVASSAPVAPATTLARANGRAVLIGALGLPAGTFAEGLAVLVEDTPVPSPTPVPTPSPYYNIPTPTPTPTVTPTPPGRKKPGLSASVRPKRDRRKPFRFTTRGTLKRPSGVSAAAGCKGKVRITVKRRGSGKTLSSRLATVKGTCKFRSRVTFKNSRRFGKTRKARRRGTLVFTIRFQGNARLTPRTVKRTARYGR